MKGGPRRNKPAALRSLHGSKRRPHHRPAVDIKPASTMSMPPGLTRSERQFFRYYLRELVAVRVLTRLDRDALVNFARALAQIAEIRQAQQAPEYGRLTETGRALDAQLRHWMQIARLSGSELGLSPVARARVTPAGGTVDKEDELETFIKTPLHRVK